MINIAILPEVFDVKINGVLHVGGYHGEEIELYKKNNIENVVFFEPIEKHFNIITETIKHSNKNYKCLNYALGNTVGFVSMNVSETVGGDGSGASSSILEPKLHLTQHPNISFNKTEEVKITKLDNIFDDCIKQKDFNMLIIDVQGYELEVIKGASETLATIDCIISEINRDEIYENCVQINELDSYLNDIGFTRAVTIWTAHDWGDALYVRDMKNSKPIEVRI